MKQAQVQPPFGTAKHPAKKMNQNQAQTVQAIQDISHPGPKMVIDKGHGKKNQKPQSDPDQLKIKQVCCGGVDTMRYTV